MPKPSTVPSPIIELLGAYVFEAIIGCKMIHQYDAWICASFTDVLCAYIDKASLPTHSWDILVPLSQPLKLPMLAGCIGCCSCSLQGHRRP